MFLLKLVNNFSVLNQINHDSTWWCLDIWSDLALDFASCILCFLLSFRLDWEEYEPLKVMFDHYFQTPWSPSEILCSVISSPLFLVFRNVVRQSFLFDTWIFNLISKGRPLSSIHYSLYHKILLKSDSKGGAMRIFGLRISQVRGFSWMRDFGTNVFWVHLTTTVSYTTQAYFKQLGVNNMYFGGCWIFLGMVVTLKEIVF